LVGEGKDGVRRILLEAIVPFTPKAHELTGGHVPDLTLWSISEVEGGRRQAQKGDGSSGARCARRGLNEQRLDVLQLLLRDLGHGPSASPSATSVFATRH